MKRKSRLLVVLLLLAACGFGHADEPLPEMTSPQQLAALVLLDEAEILMRLARAVSNWNESIAALPAVKGWESGKPPCSRSGAEWTGVVCDEGVVVEINLSGLMLNGYLPSELLQLPRLKYLNLSNNNFYGQLPPQWTSQSLQVLDLSNNVLSGPLPVDYGREDALPALAAIFLQGNLFRGSLPSPGWTSIGFAQQAAIVLRPGNDALCGAIPIVDPDLYPLPAGSADGLAPEVTRALEALQSGSPEVGTSQVFIMHQGVLGPDTSVVVTNTLGSCAEPCGRAFSVETNLLDATWANNVSLADILANNPGLTAAEGKPGTQLSLPCYPSPMYEPNPRWFGSDMAVGMFAGGNQRGTEGVLGAELAGAVVGLEGLQQAGLYYEGSYGTGAASYLQPVYWFVKMEAAFTVSAVSVTAGNPMRNVSLYVGNNATDIQANRLVQAGMDFAGGESRVIAVDHVPGKMVILYAGTPEEGVLSLANVEVFPAEANAAMHKAVIVSGPVPPKINFTTDGSLSTCVLVKAEKDGTVRLWIDLGYESLIASAAITLGRTPDRGNEEDSRKVEVLVSSEGVTLGALSNATLCGPPLESTASGGGTGHFVTQCSTEGRYVGLQIVGAQNVSVCELEVFLGKRPNKEAKNVNVARSDVVAIAVGCAVGGAVLALLLVGLWLFLRRRRRARQTRDANAAAAAAVELAKQSSVSDGDGGSSSACADALEAGKVRHDSITSGAGGVAPGHLRKWFAGMGAPSSGDSDKASPLDASPPSTDLSKFTDGCDVVDFRDIELVRTIGEGSFGLVWMARHLQTTVAVKVLNQKSEVRGKSTPQSRSEAIEATMVALQREASIMAQLRHPNCIQYLGATLNPPALIMEYCSKRSVDTILAAALLDGKLAKQLDWVHLLIMASDAAKGMLYLHTRTPPIVHRDLKSPNLLVDALGHVKVSDFNLSRTLEHNAVVSSLQITNPRWLAPEILKGGQAGTAADVYSFGVVLWELAAWSLPWGHATNPFAIINSVVAGILLPIPANEDLPAGPLACYDEYVALMRHCWAPEPADRPDFDEIAQLLRGMLSGIVQGKIDTASAAAGMAVKPQLPPLRPPQPSEAASL